MRIGALPLLLLLALPLAAQPMDPRPVGGSLDSPNAAVPPAQLRGIGFDQRIGEATPLDLPLRDENGRDTRLGAYFHGKPVLLALVYYDCPMLCTMVLNGLVSALKPIEFSAGREFEVVAVSFDPRETPPLARIKKTGALDRYGRAGSENGWHFLTGDALAIGRLTEAVGFRYAWDKEAKQYAHPAGVVLLTPDGKVARYLFGIDFAPRDVRLGLVEAASGRIGTVTDQMLLFCYHYDPARGRYSAAVMNLVRAGGAATVLVMGVFLGITWRRERRRGR